jgi:hypothetical protein
VRNAELAQVVSGVKAGDAVISSGGYALPDKTQIKVEAFAKDEKEAGNKASKDEKSDKADDPKPAKKGKE